MKKGLRISGMSRSFLASSTPGPTELPNTDDEPTLVEPTSMARRGLALSGAGRRLGISGMNRPTLERPAVATPITSPVASPMSPSAMKVPTYGPESDDEVLS